MRHGSLFSGIGGFDLAAEWMGWENVFHCEWNPFGQKILNHYWPKAESFSDITKTDFTKYANTIDILTGGFPCQPYSTAGKRKGKEDDRHLWPEMLRTIQQISPRFVVGENVRGLLNWNGGMVFDEVCSELENYGYQVAPIVIPACGVGAPHRRERVWFVATNTNRHGFNKCDRKNEINPSEGRFNAQCNIDKGHCNGDDAYTECEGLEGHNRERERCSKHRDHKRVFIGAKSQFAITNTIGIGFSPKGQSTELERGRLGFDNTQKDKSTWDNFPTKSPLCGGDDGIPYELDGITFSKWRQESIKGFGNAIVPQVAFEIFKAIQQCDESLL